MEKVKRGTRGSINETDHLVPVANGLLKVAARTAWAMFKLVGGVVARSIYILNHHRSTIKNDQFTSPSAMQQTRKGRRR